MVFEVYKPRSSNDNKVSITKHHIRLGNKLASNLSGDQVEVAYDKESNMLRIKVTDEGGMKLNKNKIGSSGIFKYFNIEDKKGSFRAEFDKKDNSIFVDLND